MSLRLSPLPPFHSPLGRQYPKYRYFRIFDPQMCSSLSVNARRSRVGVRRLYQILFIGHWAYIDISKANCNQTSQTHVFVLVHQLYLPLSLHPRLSPLFFLLVGNFPVPPPSQLFAGCRVLHRPLPLPQQQTHAISCQSHPETLETGCIPLVFPSTPFPCPICPPLESYLLIPPLRLARL